MRHSVSQVYWLIANVSTIKTKRPRYPALRSFRNLTGGLYDSILSYSVVAKPNKLHHHQLPSTVVDEGHCSVVSAYCPTSLSPTQLKIGGEDHSECGYNWHQLTMHFSHQTGKLEGAAKYFTWKWTVRPRWLTNDQRQPTWKSQLGAQTSRRENRRTQQLVEMMNKSLRSDVPRDDRTIITQCIWHS